MKTRRSIGRPSCWTFHSARCACTSGRCCSAAKTTFFKSHLQTAQRTRDLERFLAAFDPSHTLAIEAELKKLQSPTLVVWGTDDIYFDVKWGDWLAATIPGTSRSVRFQGARIFFPEERSEAFNRELRNHWSQ